MPDVSPEEALKLWLNAQAGLVSLSTRGRQILVKNANHYNILDSHADEVVRAISTVVEAARE
jgi:hypothetical protein